jgi:hypothetical protein
VAVRNHRSEQEDTTMTTKTRQVRAQKAHRVQLLPLDRLRPAADNGRRTNSARSLQSLARSIRKNGVLQPILVRVHSSEPDTWEIRAGHRRWGGRPNSRHCNTFQPLFRC